MASAGHRALQGCLSPSQTGTLEMFTKLAGGWRLALRRPTCHCREARLEVSALPGTASRLVSWRGLPQPVLNVLTNLGSRHEKYTASPPPAPSWPSRSGGPLTRDFGTIHSVLAWAAHGPQLSNTVKTSTAPAWAACGRNHRFLEILMCLIPELNLLRLPHSWACGAWLWVCGPAGGRSTVRSLSAGRHAARAGARARLGPLPRELALSAEIGPLPVALGQN